MFDWISASAWSALGTWFAAFISLFLLGLGVLTLRAQTEQQRRQLQEERARNAARVYAVIHEAKKAQVEIDYANHSPNVVRDPVFEAVDKETGEVIAISNQVLSILPTEGEKLTIAIEPPCHSASSYGIRLRFTDVNGTRWEQTPEGRIKERPLGYPVFAFFRWYVSSYGFPSLRASERDSCGHAARIFFRKRHRF